jgi:hypothetical protein
VECPLENGCDAFREQECDVCPVGQVRQMQLAYDKATMVTIPEPVEYNCRKDCHFLVPNGGQWDNPEVGGCWIEDIFPPNSRFEENDPKLAQCPYYAEPMVKLPSEKELFPLIEDKM